MALDAVSREKPIPTQATRQLPRDPRSRIDEAVLARKRHLLGVGLVGVSRNDSSFGADLDGKASHIINSPSVGAGTHGIQATRLQFGFDAGRVKILDGVPDVIHMLRLAGLEPPRSQTCCGGSPKSPPNSRTATLPSSDTLLIPHRST